MDFENQKHGEKYQELKLILDSIPSLVCYIDENFCYKYINSSYEHWFGLNAKDVIGKPILDVVGPQAYNMSIPYVKQAFKGQGSVMEFEVPYMYGGHRYVGVTLTPHINSDTKKVQGVIGLVNDITDRKKKENVERSARQRADRILEAASSLNQTLSVADVIDEIINQVANVIQPESILFILKKSKRADYDLVKTWGKDFLANGQSISKYGPMAMAVQHATPAFFTRREDVLKLYPALRDYKDMPIGGMCILPLIIDQKSFGAICVYFREEKTWPEDEKIYIRTLINQCALAFERARLIDAERESSEYLKNIFENAPVSIIISKGPDHKIDYINRNARELYGLTTNHMQQPITNIKHSGENRYIIDLMEEVMRTGQSVSQNGKPVVRPDGSTIYVNFHFQSTASVLSHDPQEGVLMFSFDVTESIHNEIELIQAKEDAESASKSKSSFLANISHEIRTPLNAILGFSNMLKDENLPSDERNSLVDIVWKNGRQLSVLINDILDFSKIEAGHMRIDPMAIKVSDIIHNVQDLFSFEIKNKKLDFFVEKSIDVPSFIYSDPLRISQILINLVGNAVKFTNKGAITLKIDLDLNKKNICFLVKDTGIGMSSSQKKNLFQVFVQADASMTRKYGGTGLGLALSQRLAQLLNGSLTLKDSSKGHGSEFLVSLPINTHKLKNLDILKIDEKVTALPEIKKDLSDKKVLVAEDSRDNQRLLNYYLSAENIVIEFANNGSDACVKAKSGDHDLILMDIQMPLMDGYAATKNLRDWGYAKPIIALTAHAMVEDRERSLREGCDAHITKPIDRKELLAVLSRFL